MAREDEVPCGADAGTAPLLSPQFQQTELGGRQAPRTPQDKERVKREIESMDRAIDRLVYELSHKGIIYGLVEEEIKIIETDK